VHQVHNSLRRGFDWSFTIGRVLVGNTIAIALAKVAWDSGTDQHIWLVVFGATGNSGVFLRRFYVPVIFSPNKKRPDKQSHSPSRSINNTFEIMNSTSCVLRISDFMSNIEIPFLQHCDAFLRFL
jgi:hypothetical protein